MSQLPHATSKVLAERGEGLSTPWFRWAEEMDRKLRALTGTVAAVAETPATPPISITGPGVTGSAESGYVITSETDPLACQIFGG